MDARSIRVRLVELDDALRALPDDAFAEKHALGNEQDACRARLRQLLGDELTAASDGWAERAGRKGEHSVDVDENYAAARIVSPGEGGPG